MLNLLHFYYNLRQAHSSSFSASHNKKIQRQRGRGGGREGGLYTVGCLHTEEGEKEKGALQASFICALISCLGQRDFLVSVY